MRYFAGLFKYNSNMAFILRSDRKETENKTIRFPLDLIQQIEVAIVCKDVSFSGFVIQACRYALQNLEEDDSKQNVGTSRQ